MTTLTLVTIHTPALLGQQFKLKGQSS